MAAVPSPTPYKDLQRHAGDLSIFFLIYILLHCLAYHLNNVEFVVLLCRKCDRVFCGPCFGCETRKQDNGCVAQFPRPYGPCCNIMSSAPHSSSNFSDDIAICASHVPQVGQSPDELLSDEDFASHYRVHSRYTIPSVKSSTPNESPGNGKSRLNNSCRSRFTESPTPASNGHSQNGVAKA